MTTLSSVYTYICTNCGEPYSTIGMAGMMEPTYCPECGHPPARGPTGQFLIPETPATIGFFECFECGHTFGYSTGGRENPYSDPQCPECGSQNVSQV